MTNNQTATSGGQQEYDLDERTAIFGEKIVGFVKRQPVNCVTEPLIRQLVRSGTSVGANYCEANEAEPDFRSNMEKNKDKRQNLAGHRPFCHL